MEQGFENVHLEEESLPKASDLPFDALDKRYKTALLVPFALGWASLFMAASVISFFTVGQVIFLAKPLALLPVCSLLLFLLLYIPAYVDACGVTLRTQDIHFKSGVFWRKVTSLPFNRIQHVELESGPLDRLFKLATLKIFTAGGGSTDMRIPGLRYDRASKLRAAILLKAGIKNAGPSDA